MTESHAPEKNWAGTYTYRAEKLHRPTTMQQVQQIVANAASVHVLGSRHSFNDIADSSELLSLENLPADVVVDHEAHTVSFGGGVTYGILVKTLNDEGVACTPSHRFPTSPSRVQWRRRRTARASPVATSRPRSRGWRS